MFPSSLPREFTEREGSCELADGGCRSQGQAWKCAAKASHSGNYWASRTFDRRLSACRSAFRQTTLMGGSFPRCRRRTCAVRKAVFHFLQPGLVKLPTKEAVAIH